MPSAAALLRMCLALVALSFASLAGAAEEQAVTPSGPVPAWLEPEVIKASLEIGLTPEQQPEFRRIVGQYITDRVAMIQQEIRRSPPNLDRVIKTKSNRLEKTMDAEMKVVLTEEQWKPFENYKKVLKSKFRAGM
jgi:hypothetical protein